MVVETEAVLITVVLVTAANGVVLDKGSVAVGEVLKAVRAEVMVVEVVVVAEDGAGLVVVEVVDEIAAVMLDQLNQEDQGTVAIGPLLEMLNGVPLLSG